MRSIQIFVAAYEERSFTLAAEREGATQSGVSQHVRQLETRHGVELFRREKGRVLPTPAADAFYTHCVEALRANEQAFQRLRQFSHGLSGEVRIGLMPTMNAAALAPALIEFRELHPNVKVSVTEAFSAALQEMIVDGELDVAVVPAMSPVPGLRITPFIPVPEVLVRAKAPDAEAPAPGASINPASLGPLKIVLPEMANIRAQTTRSYLNNQNTKIAEAIEMNSMLGTLDLIARSNWCAILPALLMRTPTYGDTFDIRLLDPPLELQLVTIESASNALPPAAEIFCQLLREKCAELLQDHSQN